MMCGSYICSNCITNWANSKLIHDRISGEVLIPCPNYQCEHSLMPMDLIKLVGMKNFEKVNETYTQIYLSTTEDVRKCPNEECKYAGIIEFKPCKKPLECPECQYEWTEFVQMTNFAKAKKSLKDFLSFNPETFSYFSKMLTGQPCPKCGLTIWKDGGCNHMVCQKCRHEF